MLTVALNIKTMIFMQTAGSAIIFIILLLWTYNRNISVIEKLGVIAFFAGYAYVLFVTPDILQQYHWDIISSSNSILSKFTDQIHPNFVF